MKLSGALIRQFSQAVGQFHAAGSESQRDQQLAAAIRTLGRSREAVWVAELLRQYVARQRSAVSEGRGKGTSGAGALTRRERQVLARIGLGETDAEIGKALGIAAKTASKHVEHVLEKLGVENRTAAVASDAL